MEKLRIAVYEIHNWRWMPEEHDARRIMHNAQCTMQDGRRVLPNPDLALRPEA